MEGNILNSWKDAHVFGMVVHARKISFCEGDQTAIIESHPATTKMKKPRRVTGQFSSVQTNLNNDLILPHALRSLQG